MKCSKTILTRHHIFRSLCLATLVLQSWVLPAAAFDISGSKWIGARAIFNVDLTGLSGTSQSWNSAFIAAMADWSNQTLFDFELVNEGVDPCISDGANGVEFVEDLCGTAFGSSTLAVTLRRFSEQALGPPAIHEADIVINETASFDIFDGDLTPFPNPYEGVDFRRVALHELGHVVGLDHSSIREAIMWPNITDLDRLQEDDILGVEALYTGLSNCTIHKLNFGNSSGSLESGDCTVQEMTVGSGDTSFIDVYRFQLDSQTELEFSMSSSVLDSVLLLADMELNYLVADTKQTTACDSSISANLQPGTYLLLANTFNVPVKEACGNSGSYQIQASFLSDAPQLLGSNTSLQGGHSNAQFRGGISNDNGNSYGNSFGPNDSLDIEAEITVDPQHQGQAGFLVVAALTGNQTLLLNEQGNFIDAAYASGPLTRAASKVLAAQEPLTIVTGLVPASLGIDSIVVEFYVGYGLETNPDEIYFHQTPINLTIAP